jgi:F0F1-type ATP synthase assembly protein I
MLGKKIFEALCHPVSMINFTLIGMLLLIQIVHTRAHHSLETDVHGHVYRTLKKTPELARSSCYKLNF